MTSNPPYLVCKRRQSATGKLLISVRELPALHTSHSLHFLKQQKRKTRSLLLKGAISYFYARLYLIALNLRPYEEVF